MTRPTEFKGKKAMGEDIYVGLDLSLVGTGLAAVDGEGNTVLVHGWTNVKRLHTTYPQYLSYFKVADAQSHAHRMFRMDLIIEWVSEVIGNLCEQYRDIYIAIEGYSLGSKGMRISDQFELGGAVKRMLWNEGLHYRIYPPTTIKKAWTGNGGANKSAMALACFKKFGLDFGVMSDAGENLVDAVLTAQLLYMEVQCRVGNEVPNGIHAVLSNGNPSILDQDFITCSFDPNTYGEALYGDYLAQLGE